MSVSASLAGDASTANVASSDRERAANLTDSLVRRQTMIDCQIRTFDVTDQRLLARLIEVPREQFVPDEARGLAYSDIGLTLTADSPAGLQRYLLPPLISARMIQGGRIRKSDRVLDVACGGGYSTAILTGLAQSVVALEAPGLGAGLRGRLAAFGLAQVHVAEGALVDGAPQDGPFDVILINGAVETNLDALFAQLAEGGRLLAIRRAPNDPTGRAAKAMCYEKVHGETGSRYLFDASAPVLPGFQRTAGFVF